MKKNDSGNGKKKKGLRPDGRFQKSKRVDGRRIYGYGYTIKEAEEDLRKKVQEAEQGVLPDVRKLTVAQYLEEYLARRELDLRASTEYKWSLVANKHIIPSLGRYQLRDLESRHVQDWIIKLSKFIKPSTVHSYYTVLHVALNDAVKSRLIARSPCENITLPSVKKTERKIISPEQLNQLLDVLEYPWLAFFVVAFSTGMRKGELLALRWEDIDFTSGVVRIHRNVTRVPGRFVEGDPKSESSNRNVILQAFALKALDDHRHQQKIEKMAADEWEEKGLVFCRDGEFWYMNAPNVVLERALEKAGLQETGITPHGGRHTLASQLLGRKFNPKVVQEILGHSDIKMTLGMYNHALPGAQEEAMQEMNSVLWGPKNEAK